MLSLAALPMTALCFTALVVAAPQQVEAATEADSEGPGSPAPAAATSQEAGDAEEPEAAVPDVSGVAPKRRDLVLGVRWLEVLEPERALASLEAAAAGGPYALDDVVSLYHHLGIARAYLGDASGAVEAFESLLAIAPGHALTYTTSPRATLLFQQALDKRRGQRALELRIETAPIVKLDAPVEVDISAVADPNRLVQDVALLHRRKGEANFRRIDLPRPEIGRTVTISLPAVTLDEASPDVEGLVGALIEVAVVGYDARGWEVYAGPAPSRPLEVPVGYIAPVPWYGQWWVWGIVGGVAVTAVATTSAVVVTRFWPKPDTVNAPYEVGG